MTSADYFDKLYADKADPWGLSTRAYEQRKLALLLAALPRRRYSTAFEPGCAIGVTTAALAQRCDRLLAMDGAMAAVHHARARLRDQAPQVAVAQGSIPKDWPVGRFDLVVLAELLYYLEDTARRDVAELLIEALAPGADVLAVHWRHPFAEAPATGDVVHAELGQRLRAAGLALAVDHVEADFLLQVYALPPREPVACSPI